MLVAVAGLEMISETIIMIDGKENIFGLLQEKIDQERLLAS